MIKLKRLNAVAALVVGTLVPGALHAEYSYGPSANFDSSFARTKAAISPTLGEKAGKPGSGVAALKAQLDRDVKKVEEQITSNKQEQELRNKVQAKTENVDKLKSLANVPSLIFANKVKQEEKKNAQLEAMLGSLSSNPGAAINPQDIDTSGLEAACSRNVDTSQFRSLGDQMKSQPYQFLQSEAGKQIASKKEEVREEKVAVFLDLMKKRKEERAKKREQKDGFQPNIAANDPFASLNGDVSDEARIARLEGDAARLEQAEKTWEDKVDDEVVKLVQGLKKFQDVRQLSAPFADNLEQFRQAMYNEAQKQGNQLYANCKRVAEDLGRDNPLAPNTLMNAAYQSLVAMHNGDANFYANGFLQGLSREARLIQCRKMQNEVEQQLGANLQNQIAQLRTASDPETLLTSASQLLTSLGNAQAEAAKAFVPVKNSCNELAKFSRRVEDFVGSAQQQMAQQAQLEQEAGLPNQRRAGSVRNPVAGRSAVHSGFGRGVQR